MAESITESKEVWLAFIAYALVIIEKMTGVNFPLDPVQIFGAGVALMAIVRILWTQGKIQSFLPKGKTE